MLSDAEHGLLSRSLFFDKQHSLQFLTSATCLASIVYLCCCCSCCFGQSILERKKNKGIIKLGQSRSGGVVISQKQGEAKVWNYEHGSERASFGRFRDFQALVKQASWSRVEIVENISQQNCCWEFRQNDGWIVDCHSLKIAQSCKLERIGCNSVSEDCDVLLLWCCHFLACSCRVALERWAIQNN